MRNLQWLAAAFFGIAAAACAEEPKPHRACIEGARLDTPLLVLESDLSAASALAHIDTQGCITESSSPALGGDPSLAVSHDRFFAVIRDSSRVAEIDPYGPALIEGRAFDIPPVDIVTNPHDVAIASDGTLWIPRYNLPSLAVLNEDGTLAAEVDLSAYADDDGIPEMEAAIAIGDKVYVSLERLSWTGSRYIANESSMIVGIDVESHEVVESFVLKGRTPFGRLVPSPSDDSIFFAVVPGEFDAIDERDGIERIDTRRGISELVIDEVSLGGSPSEVAIISDTEGYAIVARPEVSNDTSLVRWNPATGKVENVLATTEGRYGLWGLAWAGGDIVIGDRDRKAPRVRIFSRETGAERGSIPLEVLPPVAIIALR